MLLLGLCFAASRGKFYGVYCNHLHENRIPFISVRDVDDSSLKTSGIVILTLRCGWSLYWSSVRWIRKCKLLRSSRYKIALFYSLRVFKLRGTGLSKKKGTALITLLHIKNFWEELMISVFHLVLLPIQSYQCTLEISSYTNKRRVYELLPLLLSWTTWNF